MGTKRSRHNKGRKPLYKDHRRVAAHLLERPRGGETLRGYHFMSGTWWTPIELFKLDILCEADADIEQAADVFARRPTTLAHKARAMGLTLPYEWAKLIAPKRKRKLRKSKEPPLNYPYIKKARDEHADILAINDLIPKTLTDNMRADICQEIMLAILEGRTTLEMLRAKKANSQYFVKKFYHSNFEHGGHAISFQETSEDWNEDRIASSIASKEWARDQDATRVGHVRHFTQTYTPATQFEAAWQSQVG